MRENSSPAGATERVHSIDVVRGLVMVLMAIDHVRVYAGVPAWSAEPATFFTRWVTHFCAPAFVFLAGTSAFLSGRSQGPGELARKLLIRGGLLILLELTLVRVAWTFNFDFGRYMLAGVLWMIGWCMILMALLVRLPLPAIAGFGVLMIAGHNLSALLSEDSVRALLSGALGWLFRILYFGGGIATFGTTPNLFVLYSLVPWIGVMAAGYAFGRVVCLDRPARDRACLAIGLGSIAGFLLLRGFNLYGDRPWHGGEELPGFLAFLNTTKYPASLLFLLMTLGPTIAMLPLARQGSRTARGLAHRVRSRALRLLPAAHSPDSPVRGRRLARAHAGRHGLAVPRPSAAPGPGPGRVHVEPRPSLRRDGALRGHPVLPLPMVRRAEGAAKASLAQLSLRLARRAPERVSRGRDVVSRGEGPRPSPRAGRACAPCRPAWCGGS